MKQVLTGLLLAIGLGTGMGQAAHAQAANDTTAPRTVRVTGEGSVTAEPDRAVVRFGVVTQAEEAEAAREQNATASAEAMNTVRELGIPERQIQMETLRLQPQREYNREERRYEENGFEAIRQVVVELDSLDLLPTLVTRVVQRGANRLDGVHYDLQDRDAVRNEALREAASSAREKATLLAEALNARLGTVRQISEQSFDFPRPQARAFQAEAATADAAAPEPDAYAAGEIEVTANVQVVFDLVPGE